MQWSLYALLILGLYSGFRFLVPGGVSRKRIIGVAAILLLGGTALAMIQLLPTLEYVALGHRQPLTPEALSSAQNWSSFLMLWVPRFFRRRLFAPRVVGACQLQRVDHFCRHRPAHSGLGRVGRAAKVAGAFLRSAGPGRRVVRRGPSEVYRLVAWVPGFNSLGPIRMRYLTVVSLSMLSALGLDWLLSLEYRLRANAD